MFVKLAIGITGSEKRISIKPVLLIDSIHTSMGSISCSASKMMTGGSERIMMLKDSVVSCSLSSIAFTVIGKVPVDSTLSGKSLIVTFLAEVLTNKNS